MKHNWHLLFVLILLLPATALLAQSLTVKGIVKGEDAQPLVGVVVKVEGTTKGTVTDLNGYYQIDVPGANSRLIFSYVGMQTQTLPAGNGELNVTLKAGVEIKEVVVTALGVSKETKALGYSVSTVSGDAVRESGETNVIESLAAKAPGVQVTGSGGSPGASSKILIRGNNTLTGDNQPLIVVDGVPIDNSVNNITGADNPYNPNLAGVNESNRALDINPDDIESVSILKGAAAAALYGSKASNGAIIYTTKRAKAGKGIGATYTTSVELDHVNKLPKLQNRWAQGDNGIYTPLATGNSWGPLASTVGPTYDNVGNYFRTGVLTNNNLALTGGNENSSVRMSVGNTHQTGVIPNSKLNRTSVRLTADTKVNDWFDMGGTVNYTNTSTLKPQNGSNKAGTMLSLLRTPISFDASNYLNSDGTQRQYFAAFDNPFFTAYQNPFTDETNRVIGNVFINLKAKQYYSLTTRVGTDIYHTNNQQIYAISSVGNDAADGSGQINRTSIDFRNLYSDVLGKFSRQITDDFGANVMLGYNFQYQQGVSIFTRGKTLAIPNFYNFGSAASLYTSNSESYSNSNAVMLDAAFDYKRALYLTMTGRNEWNSAFGPNGKSFFYPKADIAWDFSENIHLPKWFSFGKVRASYASVGKAPGPYSNVTGYAIPTVADGWTSGLGFPYGGSLPGYSLSNTLNSSDLRPERTNEYEAGTDLRFLDSRVTLDLSVYQRVTTDVLLFQPVAPTSGYLYRFTNAGQISNHGMEIALGLVPVKYKDFSWNITVNWSKNVSNIDKLANGVDQYLLEQAFGDPGPYAIVGHPYGIFYGSAWKRDANGNLLIGANGVPEKTLTYQIIGNPNPDWIGGVMNSFKYKSWAFSFLWDIRKGGQIWNGTQASLNSRGRSLDSDARDGSNATYVIPGVMAPDAPDPGKQNTTPVSAHTYFTAYMGQNGPSENSIQDGGWVRLRSVNLSYRINLPKPEKKSYVQYVEVGLSARNLLLFTKYTGVDPETSLTGAGSNINGFDYFNNPGTKSYMLNLKVGL